MMRRRPRILAGLVLGALGAGMLWAAGCVAPRQSVSLEPKDEIAASLIRDYQKRERERPAKVREMLDHIKHVESDRPQRLDAMLERIRMDMARRRVRWAELMRAEEAPAEASTETPAQPSTEPTP